MKNYNIRPGTTEDTEQWYYHPPVEYSLLKIWKVD